MFEHTARPFLLLMLPSIFCCLTLTSCIDNSPLLLSITSYDPNSAASEDMVFGIDLIARKSRSWGSRMSANLRLRCVDMATYEYQPLDHPEHDIRLLTLLPGSYFEPLIASISHVSLIRPPKPLAERISLAELRLTTPSGWTAYETVEGPYIFRDEESGRTSWNHPTTGENFLYSFEDYPPNGFEPCYEALSYTWGKEQCLSPLLIQQSFGDRYSHGRPALQELSIGRNLAEALFDLV